MHRTLRLRRVRNRTAQKPLLQLRRRERPREKESLCLVAPARAQPLQLALTLYALGGDYETQRLGERENGVGDCSVARRAVHVTHECLVDLEAIGRKASDVGERGVAGAEVIERNAASELPQPLERLAHLAGVLHQDRL